MSEDQTTQSAPIPSAEPQHAEKYIDWLTELINREKVEVYHSDLTKFNIDSMQDHYRITLQDYEVELSHSKKSDTGEDMFVMIFNNLKNLATNACERTILSYIHLSRDQFEKFKVVADNQINRRVRLEKEKHFKEVMAPVDALLDSLTTEAGTTQTQATLETPTPSSTPLDNQPQESFINPFAQNSPTFSTDPAATLPTNNNLTQITEDAASQPNLTPNLVKPPLPPDYNPANFAPIEEPQVSVTTTSPSL